MYSYRIFIVLSAMLATVGCESSTKTEAQTKATLSSDASPIYRNVRIGSRPVVSAIMLQKKILMIENNAGNKGRTEEVIKTKINIEDGKVFRLVAEILESDKKFININETAQDNQKLVQNRKGMKFAIGYDYESEKFVELDDRLRRYKNLFKEVLDEFRKPKLANKILAQNEELNELRIDEATFNKYGLNIGNGVEANYSTRVVGQKYFKNIPVVVVQTIGNGVIDGNRVELNGISYIDVYTGIQVLSKIRVRRIIGSTQYAAFEETRIDYSEGSSIDVESPPNIIQIATNSSNMSTTKTVFNDCGKIANRNKGPSDNHTDVGYDEKTDKWFVQYTLFDKIFECVRKGENIEAIRKALGNDKIKKCEAEYQSAEDWKTFRIESKGKSVKIKANGKAIKFIDCLVPNWLRYPN